MLTWHDHWPDWRLLHACWILHYNCWSVVCVVISARLNVTQASRHCMVELRFTHLFPNSHDMNNNTSEITQSLHARVWTHTGTHCAVILVRTRKYICIVFVSILDFCSPCSNRHGWLGVNKQLFILISAFANVASWSTSDSLINISILCFRWIVFGLRVKWNKHPLDIPIKGVNFPSDLFSVHSWPSDRRTTRHLRCQTSSRLELWIELSGDITAH